MFKELRRKRILNTLFLNQQVKISIIDDCFTEVLLDNYCSCPYANCSDTLIHLYKIYSNRKLNVYKNVAQYYIWLNRNFAYSISEEMDNQLHLFATRYPYLLNINNFERQVRQYIKLYEK